MADIKFIRATEERVPVYSDGQLIFTDEGNAYVDFPDTERIRIGNGINPTNLLEFLDPSALNIEYSTQGTGMLCQITDKNNNQLAHQYFTQGVPTSWEHCTIPFKSTMSNSYINVQVRKAAEDIDYIPGDFAFDNFEIHLKNASSLQLDNLIKKPLLDHVPIYPWVISTKAEAYCKLILHDGRYYFTVINPGTTFKYENILTQEVEVNPNTPYQFDIEMFGLTGQADGEDYGTTTPQGRFYFFDQNGTQLTYATTGSTSIENRWYTHSMTVITKSDTTKITVALRCAGSMRFNNVSLKVKLPQIKNGNFENGLTNWDTSSTYNSDYIPEELITENGNSYIRTKCTEIGPEHTSAGFIKQTHIYVEKDIEYILSFDIKRLSESAVWQPYTTIMEDDKLMLMSAQGKLTGEYPKFGGPWANSLHYDYILRGTITKPDNVKFDILYLGILTHIVSSKGSKIIVDYSNNGIDWTSAGGKLYDENVEWANEVLDSFKLIPLKRIKNDDFKYLRITITFQGDSDLVKEDLKPTENFVKGFRLYGQTLNIPNEPKTPYFQDIKNNIYYQSNIIASQFIGNIDDGSIDWRDL